MDDRDWFDDEAVARVQALETRALALSKGLSRRIRTGRLDEHDREHWIA